MKVKLCLLFLLLNIFCSSLYARRGDGSKLYVISRYEGFSDLSLSSSDEAANTFSDSIGVELGIRLKNTYNLIFLGSKAVDSTRSEYGLGLRVGLPGFFLIGGRRSDLERVKKKYPVNTSGYVAMKFSSEEATTVGNSSQTSIVSILGLTVDIFLFNPIVFLSSDFALYNHRGNILIKTSVGLGAEF